MPTPSRTSLEAIVAAGRDLVASGGVEALTMQAVAERVVGAARKLVEEDGAEAVVLCGAAMAGMAEKLKAEVPVPLVDGIASGVPLCEMLVRLGTVAPQRGSLLSPAGRETVGLDPALAALLGQQK